MLYLSDYWPLVLSGIQDCHGPLGPVQKEELQKTWQPWLHTKIMYIITQSPRRHKYIHVQNQTLNGTSDQ